MFGCEVVCNCRKFIQSVSVGHPGTRNDKHIVRTDQTVMDLLEGNNWLNSKTWCSTGVNGTRKLHRGVYLICDGGYHRWPVLINPYKDTIPGSAIMKFSAKLESVRKDIEGVRNFEEALQVLEELHRCRIESRTT